MSRIFISHAGTDGRQAIALKRWLAEQNPRLANEIFLDLDPTVGIRTGERWAAALQRANARCEAVVCLLSKEWESRVECLTEYRTAETLNKLVFCARLEPETGSKTSAWQWCDLFGDGPTTEIDIGDGEAVAFATRGLYQLRDGIRGAGIGADSFAWPGEGGDRAPYRGWQPLDPQDAGIFFGRDAQIVASLDAVRGMRKAKTKPWFVIQGPSGSGKSSFLRAGLIPRLQRDDREFLVLGIVRPERDVMTGPSGLARAICQTRLNMGLTDLAEGDIDDCIAEPDRVRELLREMQETAQTQLLDRGEDVAPPTLVLPLDQAEELLSGDGEEQAATFLRLVRDLVAGPEDERVDLIIAASIRSDRFGLLQTRPELAEAGIEVFAELKPMPIEQFKEVIIGPARRANQAGKPLDLTPDLVDQLLDDCKAGTDTLPLLALTLSRLNEKYGSTGQLTHAQYKKMGGLHRVVQNVIDGILDSDTDRRQNQLELLRMAFIPWLATVNPDNDQPMRRVAPYQRLPEASRPLIDELVAKRLMVKATDGEEVVVEVALESLLWEWDELASWLAEQRADLKAADDLERLAKAWIDNDRDPSWLVTGSRLTDSLALVDNPLFRDRLDGVREFVEAADATERERMNAEERRRQAELDAAEEKARDAEERRQIAEAHTVAERRHSRVLRAVLAATALVAVVAVVVGVFAVVARRDAQNRFREATGLRLATEAQSMLAHTRPGGDVRALQQLTAAATLAGDTVYSAVYGAAVNRAETLKIIQTSANSVAFAPDGLRIATAGADGTVSLWNAETGLPVGKPLTGLSEWVTSVAFSPDGALLAAASRDSTVRLWNAADGSPVGEPLVGHRGPVTSVAFSAERVATGGADGTVRLWTRDGARVGNPLTGHGDQVTDIAFSPDGLRLATSSRDSTIRFWDGRTGAPQGGELTLPGPITSVALGAQRLATGSEDGTVRLWNVQTRTAVAKPMTGHSAPVTSVAFSPDGDSIVTSSRDSTVRLWDSTTGVPLGETLTDHGDSVSDVAFSPIAQRLVSSSDDGTVRVWNAEATVPLGQPLEGHRGAITSVAFSDDRLATGSADGTVRLWSPDNGGAVGAPLRHASAVNGVAFSADGRRLATAGADGTVRLWDVQLGTQVLEPLGGHGPPVTAIAFGPDLIATGGMDGSVRIWDADTGTPVGKPIPAHTDQVNSVAFSTDGSRLATAGADSTARIWNPVDGTPIGEPLSGHRGWVTDVAFSHHGDLLATAGRDDSVRIWDAASGRPVGEPITGHTYWVTSVAFSPDDTMLATASADGTARLWNTDTRTPLGDALPGHADELTSVEFSPDGRLIATGGSDQMVRIWLSTATKDDLCAKLTYNMSAKQWAEWVSPDITYQAACPGLEPADD